ncbi:hypothetical protein ACOZ38_36270 [Sphaerisporangium viridialbum]|uniref:hypothetical protein n=1 Tax=Sphaerisporangium viridialbum TaxID=46189 RepID=UPI003C71A536
MVTDLHEDAAKAPKRPATAAPGWFFLSTATVAALISFYLTSVPYIYMEALVYMFLAWSFLGIIWIIRLAGTLRITHQETRRWPTTIRWLLVPLIFVGSVLAIKADVPFQVRFKLSQSSLEHYAAKLAQRDHNVGCQWVGLYYTCGEHAVDDGTIVAGGAEAIDGGAQVMVIDWPLISSRGFLWLPDRREPPEDAWCDDYRHLVGPWWGCRTWDGF